MHLIRHGGADPLKFRAKKLIDVKLNLLDLRETTFENCIFTGVDFKLCDLCGACFGGQIFIGVKFDKDTPNDASFWDATLKGLEVDLSKATVI